MLDQRHPFRTAKDQMTPQDAFSIRIADAAHSTPGGVLTPADEAGLVRRGVSLGLTEAEVRQIIQAQHIRPRAPITRGIE